MCWTQFRLSETTPSKIWTTYTLHKGPGMTKLGLKQDTSILYLSDTLKEDRRKGWPHQTGKERNVRPVSTLVVRNPLIFYQAHYYTTDKATLVLRFWIHELLQKFHGFPGSIVSSHSPHPSNKILYSALDLALSQAEA